MITRQELNKYPNRNLDFYQSKFHNGFEKNQIIIINDNKPYSKRHYIYKVKIIDVLNDGEFDKTLNKKIENLSKIKQLKNYIVSREKFSNKYEYEELYIKKLEYINKKIKNNTLRKIFYLAQYKLLNQKYPMKYQLKYLKLFNDLVGKTIKLEVKKK